MLDVEQKKRNKKQKGERKTRVKLIRDKRLEGVRLARLLRVADLYSAFGFWLLEETLSFESRKGEEGKVKRGFPKGSKENGVRPFIPSLCTYASSIDRNRRGEFPMWGGSYLIHSPWVLPTLLGDYFTASGGREREGRGDETCRLYRASGSPKSIPRIFASGRTSTTFPPPSCSPVTCSNPCLNEL